MKYSHIIFDIDGTLTDSEHALLSSLQETVATLTGKSLPFDALRFAMGLPGNSSLPRLGITDLTEANRLWNANLRKYSATIHLYDGIRSLLDRLQQHGYRMGIITSKSHEELDADFSPLGIDSYFETILCATDSPRPKPYPDPLLSYMQRTGTSPHELLYIGDTRYDCQCALDAGVDFGLAEWGCSSREGIAATYVFHTPHDVLHVNDASTDNQ